MCPRCPWRFWDADDRTGSPARAYLIIVLVEYLDASDELVAELGSADIAGECLLYDLDGDMDAFRFLPLPGPRQGPKQANYECQKACHVRSSSSRGFMVGLRSHHTPDGFQLRCLPVAFLPY